MLLLLLGRRESLLAHIFEFLPEHLHLLIPGPNGEMVKDDGACHSHVQAAGRMRVVRYVYKVIADLFVLLDEPGALVPQEKHRIALEWVFNHALALVGDLYAAYENVVLRKVFLGLL